MYHAKKDSAIKQQRTTPDARFKPWIASPVTAISRLFNEHFPKFDHQQWNYNPLTSQFTFFVTLFYTFTAIILTPCWSVLEFWKIKLEKSSSPNWIFSLQKTISKLIFAGYTVCKFSVWNRLKIQFVELDFSNLIFQKSSTDG